MTSTCAGLSIPGELHFINVGLTTWGATGQRRQRPETQGERGRGEERGRTGGLVAELLLRSLPVAVQRAEERRGEETGGDGRGGGGAERAGEGRGGEWRGKDRKCKEGRGEERGDGAGEGEGANLGRDRDSMELAGQFPKARVLEVQALDHHAGPAWMEGESQLVDEECLTGWSN